MTPTLGQVLEKLEKIERLMTSAPRSDGEAAAHAAGLLSYEDLQDRLTIGIKNPRKPCLRTVKELVRRHKRAAGPVELGHTLVGFRPANVEKLLAALAGEEPPGRSQL